MSELIWLELAINHAALNIFGVFGTENSRYAMCAASSMAHAPAITLTLKRDVGFADQFSIAINCISGIILLPVSDQTGRVRAGEQQNTYIKKIIKFQICRQPEVEGGASKARR